ncbi:MAG: YkgJ family cysteine cluster protein [Planctomycetota bacterium]|nr:YkgJ family cysteine cluster protein [Planctomycetota bacterium]
MPFRFECHRCGHCCTGGSGLVWVEPDELPGLAAALGCGVEELAAGYLRRVSDPTDGRSRLSLRERAGGGWGGPCLLLDGSAHCRAYAARPRHCREFPFWPSILEDADAFERARSTCPGIAVVVPVEVRARAFEALEWLYGEVSALVQETGAACRSSGACCRFEEAGHELFATALEADYAAARHPDAPPPEAPGRCPYHVAGRCTARGGRALGCRTFFCEPETAGELAEAHERFLARLRAIERDCGYPAAYGRFPALLAARGVGGVRAGGETSE